MRRLMVLAMAGIGCGETVDDSIQQSAAGTTVVSLTFDDTFADQQQVAAMVAARGMHATFYVNSPRVGAAGSMSLAQLIAMQQAGNELGGHTLLHPNLPTLDVAEQRRQICNDRVALLGLGFTATSFAYPFGAADVTTEQIVADCGYNSARGVGGLVNPNSCDGCPFANPIPAVDIDKVRTPDSIKVDTTLDVLEGFVTQAEVHGGGWVPLVFHHVCDGCNDLSVSTTTLAAFLDWLAARAATGTIVKTMQEVTGGPVKAAILGPPPVGNLLENPSLELDSNRDGVPECWQRGGFGTNTATFAVTNDAADGVVAQRIDVTSFTSGARRLVTQQDLGPCAPVVLPTHAYVVGARYHATSQPMFTIYYRTSGGAWVWFAQSPLLPASASYVTGSYTTPAFPAAATAISVGLSIVTAGSITMDAFTLRDAETTPPVVSIVAPANNTTVAGTVTLTASASDASGVEHVDFLINGVVVGTAHGPFSIAWDSTTIADSVVSLTARAVDTPGNTALSTARTITIDNVAVDTTPPVTTITCNGTPCSAALYPSAVTVGLAATDGESGVAAIHYSLDGSPPSLVYASPVVVARSATLQVSAIDVAGNLEPVHVVRIAIDAVPPTAAVSSPADGASVTGIAPIVAAVTDNVAVTRVRFYLDGNQLGTRVVAPFKWNWATSTTTLGPHTLAVQAEDAAGNATRSATISVTVH